LEAFLVAEGLFDDEISEDGWSDLLIPRLHDQANIKQTSNKHPSVIHQSFSKRRANVKQTLSN